MLEEMNEIEFGENLRTGKYLAIPAFKCRYDRKGDIVLVDREWLLKLAEDIKTMGKGTS